MVGFKAEIEKGKWKCAFHAICYVVAFSERSCLFDMHIIA